MMMVVIIFDDNGDNIGDDGGDNCGGGDNIWW
jgi:hypothetical protein